MIKTGLSTQPSQKQLCAGYVKRVGFVTGFYRTHYLDRSLCEILKSFWIWYNKIISKMPQANQNSQYSNLTIFFQSCLKLKKFSGPETSSAPSQYTAANIFGKQVWQKSDLPCWEEVAKSLSDSLHFSGPESILAFSWKTANNNFFFLWERNVQNVWYGTGSGDGSKEKKKALWRSWWWSCLFTYLFVCFCRQQSSLKFYKLFL